MTQAGPITAEIWRWVAGYEGRYRVSDCGQVQSYFVQSGGNGEISTLPQQLLKLCADKNGYQRAHLRDGNGNMENAGVHRLVLKAFVGPCPDGMECAHLDGTRTNNCVDNLRWVTREENESHKILHGTSNRGERHNLSVLTNSDVRQIRGMFANGTSRQFLVDKYKVCRSTINRVISRKSWSHVK